MSVNLDLQISNLQNVPFVGSGKKLVKKEIGIGSKVIVKSTAGDEYTVEIIKDNLNNYVGIVDSSIQIEFNKQNVFLIL